MMSIVIKNRLILRSRLALLGCVAALVTVSWSPVFANGTPAGTVIRTQAKATYRPYAGVSVDTVYSNVVSVAVVQSAVINITPAAAEQSTISDSTNADYAVTVTNSGNGTDAFALTALSSKGWTVELYSDANGDGVLQSNEVLGGQLTQTRPMASDESYKVILRVRVPRNASLNGQKDTANITARSTFNAAVSAQGKYITTVRTALLTGPLTVTNPSPAPGETVTFTCLVSNAGSIAASDVLVASSVRPGFTFVSAAGGTVTSTAGPVTWSLGTLAPGASVPVSLTMQINTNVTPQTVLYDQMTVTYAVNGIAGSFATNAAQVTISSGIGGQTLYGVSITSASAAVTGEATDTLTFRYRVTNTGNVKDVIRLTTPVSSGGFVWNLYADKNNNGKWDQSDQLLTMGSIGVDSLAAGDSVRVFAMTVLPRFTADRDTSKDTLTVTATSSGDGSTSSAKTVTTINVPFITDVRLNIVPVGNHPAGTELTYTITYKNKGHAGVDNFTVIDTAPQFTEYVAGTIKVDGVQVADTDRHVVISSDPQHNTLITVAIGKFSSTANGSVEFKVKVK